MIQRLRAVVVVSHPIQYYAPLYRRLAQSQALDVTVLFASKIGLEVRRDEKMGVDMAWNTDLISGYAHHFLAGAEAIERTTFFGIDNPGVDASLTALDPQVLLLHGYAAMTNLKALLWARGRGRPLVMVSDASMETRSGLLRRGLRCAIRRRLFGQFAAFLTLGDRGEDYLAAHGVERRRMFRTPAVIDDGFWRARAARADRRAACRRRLGIGEDEVLLLCVGKLYAGKRVHDVIAALQGLDIRLVIAGDGVLRPALERAAALAGVKAQFLGFVNIDVLSDLYAAADLLAHAAQVEQYGMVLVEAAVVGLPLIVSDRVGAVGDTAIARPGVNALIYPCGDVSALRRAIVELADDPQRRSQLAAASLSVSAEHCGARSLAGVEAACRFAAGVI